MPVLLAEAGVYLARDIAALPVVSYTASSTY
jgi:hypothetical protein